MTSVPSYKAYLLRALMDWASDSGYTPCMLVNSRFPGIKVPVLLLSSDRILFDISPNKITSLVYHTRKITFDTFIRKQRKVCSIELPVNSILSFYVRETEEAFDFSQDFVPISDLVDPFKEVDSLKDDSKLFSKKKDHLFLL